MRMQPTAYAVRLLISGSVAAALLAGSDAAAAPPPVAVPPSPATVTGGHHSGYAGLRLLADLSAGRLATAFQVAAAKWGTGKPIDDPAREQQVLDTAARQARAAGADPAVTVRIFRDQIEANKQVQRALHHRWDADPSRAPSRRPDLAEVRKEINRLNADLVAAIADTATVRTDRSCGGTLTAAETSVRIHDRLGHLHAKALKQALRSVCARSSFSHSA
ncbi:gamma subclass chorismate mutase AroQ [Streptomyces sp. NPDC050392]|uniref:gamma subclass chorismate mutase AroQ n=1 Tax=Streptomyces sp. NPDC050392 TaxID=3155782 RepID=UPI00341D88AF